MAKTLNNYILSYIGTHLGKEATIIGLGNNEIQTIEQKGDLPTNLVFEEKDDKLSESIYNILDKYEEIEKKSWEENGKPKNHLYHDLLILKTLIE